MLQRSSEKIKLIKRARRIRSQLEAVERALDQNIGIADVLQIITDTRGAINGLMAGVIEDHIHSRLVKPGVQPGASADAVEELIDVMRCYLK